VSLYPRSFKKAEKLAKRVNHDFTTDHEKARAIFSWIAHNIAYDVEEYLKTKTQSIYLPGRNAKQRAEYLARYEARVVKDVLRRSKAICNGYSLLYRRLCDLTGVVCKRVTGIARTEVDHIGKFTGGPHAWNAVRIGGKWKLVDPTWGAGYVDRDRQLFRFSFKDEYFFIKPELLALSHYPNEKQWLMTDMTREQFAAQPLYHAKEPRLTLSLPTSGIISIDRPEPILFKIKSNGYRPQIRYQYRSEQVSEEVNYEADSEYLYFTVLPTNKESDELSIIIDNKVWATFKTICDKKVCFPRKFAAERLP
jgi:hypothetical protein